MAATLQPLLSAVQPYSQQAGAVLTRGYTAVHPYLQQAGTVLTRGYTAVQPYLQQAADAITPTLERVWVTIQPALEATWTTGTCRGEGVSDNAFESVTIKTPHRCAGLPEGGLGTRSACPSSNTDCVNSFGYGVNT